MCFAGYGVTTDAETSSTARIMVVSLIPFLILLVAKVLNSTTGIRIVILVSLLVSFAFLVTYCVYQVTHKFKKSTQNFSKYFLQKKKYHLSFCYALLNKTKTKMQVFEPWIQKRRLEFLMSTYVQKTLLPSFLTASGTPNVSNIQE